MRQLLHTLYVMEPDVTLHLAGKALEAVHEDGRKDHIPLHMLEKIVSFSCRPASPSLMARCADSGVDMVFLSQSGRFRYRVTGKTQGNVLLRKQQHTLSEQQRFSYAKAVLRGKLYGEIFTLSRFRRNHPKARASKGVEQKLNQKMEKLEDISDTKTLRGVEGAAAKAYFSVFNDMILPRDPLFCFDTRTRRPPKDRCNAMLSFAYELLAMDCVSALESAGLDPYAGFFHEMRPGKPSLALDLMEEFRSSIADRHVLRMINLHMISSDLFQEKNGGIYLNDAGRQKFLQEWNRMRQKEVELPDLDTKAPVGLLPHLQAARLARCLRGEEAEYQPVRRR